MGEEDEGAAGTDREGVNMGNTAAAIEEGEEELGHTVQIYN